MSGGFKLGEYIKATGLRVGNTQKLLSYYRELYQLYTDAGMPDNKYIYFLEENLHTNPFTTIPPEIFDFMSLKQDELNLLTSYIRIFKKIPVGQNEYKILEFPFENKTNFNSFADPLRYLNNKNYPFASPRFMGPVAEIKNINVRFSGGTGGKSVTDVTKNFVDVSFTLYIQDAKLLFKNWTDKDNELQYKDLFASKGTYNNDYSILLEIGYNTPSDNPIIDLSKIKRIASKKSIIDLTPSAGGTVYDFKEDGSLELKTTLFGKMTGIKNIINILDNKYYSKLKKKNNIPTLDEPYLSSIHDFNETVGGAPALNTEVKKEQKLNPNKVQSKPSSKTKNQQGIRKNKRILQLINNVKAIPAAFPFITALYEAGLIYYFEIDNQVYKDYIKKIADGLPVDVTDINIVPKKNKKLRLQPGDLLKRNSKTSTTSNTLNIKKLSDLKEDKSNTKTEKVKFFYFGDLVEIMLNDQQGTGVGQDLGSYGKDNFKFLFGQIMWIKNANTKILYNILSTPIALDMFLHELAIDIYTKNKKQMSLEYFFSTFMKRFFDNIINSTEKTKTGQDQQSYSGEKTYSFDKAQFLLNKESDNNKAKFKKRLYQLRPTGATSDVVSVNLITAMPLESGAMTNSKRKKRNIPTLYLGGVDKGPLGAVKISTDILPGHTEAAQWRASRYKGELNTKDSISESSEATVLISRTSTVEFTLFGNSFINLDDHVFVDSRFVDGGFFQSSENKVLLTGMYKIIKASHKFSDGKWLTDYTGRHVDESTTEENSFNSLAGIIPDDQNSSIATNANNNQANILNSAIAGTVNKPNKSQGSTQSSGIGIGSGLDAREKSINGDSSIPIPSKNKQ